MATIEWSDNISVGVEAIDNQHRTLFQHANDLLAVSANDASANRGTAAKILGYLESYVILHFNDEEKLMVKVGFPGYEDHKKDHEAFKSRLTELREIFIREGLTPDLVGSLEGLLMYWLVEHIIHRDKEIGRYINNLAST